MNIVFLGTSDFAIPSLRIVAESGHNLCAVVTQPDRKKGRRLVVTPPPIKTEAKRLKIQVYQPTDASCPDVVEVLKGYGADIFVVVEYGQILKRNLLTAPKKFCLNVHASMLPKYRGAAPVNWAVIKGENTTGVTTIKMDDRMDTGDIILNEEVNIHQSDTSQTLKARLAEIGADLLRETLDMVSKKRARFTKQNDKEATYAPLLKKEDGHIDWSASARDIHNRIRGLIPWPGAYTCWHDKMIKMWDSEYNDLLLAKKDIGKIVRLDGDIAVGTGRGELIIKTVQLEGGRRLDAASFLRGHRLSLGDKLD